MTPDRDHQHNASNAPQAATQPHSERGVALLLAIFMIALSAILLVSLADSTYVTMRLNSATERRVQAEYILKSAVNFARVLIKNDITPDKDDPTQDAWMQFSGDGREIPGEMLGLPDQNVRITLSIGSLTGKFPIQGLLNQSGEPDKKFIEILKRLLDNLGFNNPTTAGSSSSAISGASAATPRAFSTEQLVANIVDYLDTDQTSFSLPGLPNTYQGIEGELDPDAPLRNDRRFDSLASELALVPGFTSAQVKQLLPHLANSKHAKININFASAELIQALDPNISKLDADKIVQFRTPGGGGPFTANDLSQQLNGLVDPTVAQNISSMLSANTKRFQIIAKVDYGTSVFMASAELDISGRSAGKPPDLKALMLY